MSTQPAPSVPTPQQPPTSPTPAHPQAPAPTIDADRRPAPTPLDELWCAWCQASEEERLRFLVDVERLPY